MKIKIHQKETIRPVGSSCSCKQKEKVFVNRAKPLYVSGKARHVVVPANKPIIVKTSPVVIRQKGDVEVRPIHITKQPPPLIVTKKIVKLHQPIIKKYYVEKYRRQEDGLPAHIVSQKISKKTCDCPISEHVISPKFNWVREDSSPKFETEDDQAVRVLHDDDADVEEVEAQFEEEEA